MLRFARCVSALIVATVLLAPARAAEEGLTKADLAKLGKAATVLVENKARKAQGSAFCIHASGFFLTNQHVVASAEPGEALSIILDPGLKTQKIVAADVVRSDKDRDLALLRVKDVKDLPALTLGSIDGLSELQEVVAIGFPFGTALGEDQKEYPTVSVNVGSITSLRKKGGELNRIQLDAALNPGNSGGPVLDKNGKVVGVVVSGVRGSGVNFAIPVSHVIPFVAKPEIDFTPPVVSAANLHKPVEFQAKAVQVVPSEKAIELELILRTEDGKERTFPMGRAAGIYRATAVPVPAADGPVLVRVTINFANGNVASSTVDRTFKIGNKEAKLSAVRTLTWQPKPSAALLDGTTIEGPMTGLDSLEVQLGKETLKVGLAAATSAACEVNSGGDFVACTIVARQADQEIGRVSAKIAPTIPVAGGSGPETNPVKPPALDKDKVVKELPAAYDDLAIGGGGRFLIFKLPTLKKLAVFDVNEAKVVKYIPLPEDKVKFAAGMDKLMIVLVDKKVLQRYSLTTFEKESAVQLEVKEEVKSVVMGCASKGPVLVNADFYDVRTMKPLEVKPAFPASFDQAAHVIRASPDGRMYGHWVPNNSPEGIRVSILLGNELKTNYVHDTVGHITPGSDGKTVFTANGLLSLEGKPLNDKQKGQYCIPSLGGLYYLVVPLGGAPGLGQKDKPVDLGIYVLGDTRPLISMPKFDLWEGINSWDREAIGNDLRIQFIPAAKVIVTLPPTNDRIVLTRFDVEDALAKSDLDYLVVTSQPPNTVAKGGAYTYQITAKAQKGAIKYRLESGPEGMAVDESGKLTWKAPADFKAPDVDVLVLVSSASGREAFHGFKIEIAK
jgi:S1-C subfamily serine protease